MPKRVAIPSEELRRLYVEEGWSCQVIGARYECSGWTVGDHLRRAGIALRQRHESTAARGKARDEKRAQQKAKRAADLDFIARYAGQRTLAWMAGHLSLSERTIQNLIWRNDLAPTTRDDLLTSGHVADIIGCSQQWVTALIRRGALQGHRNPGGRWWLVWRDSVSRYLSKHGQRADDPRLTDQLVWPRVVVAKRRRKAGRT